MKLAPIFIASVFWIRLFFQLPDPYADLYQGSGGSSHTAGMKIQLEYELKTGDFLQVDVGPGKNNDGLYGTKRAKTVEATGETRQRVACARRLLFFF
ncbi:transposase [Paenibacillus sp. SYP-B3998]|uniref:Transposase n=1 Tax=Paenibacillus sp. SYP-B3998 TaxID=2678564 RepID=A0A6G3ZUR6_9BACL|nr:transposase [Paenibacillus sp. SYP-B3998]NEW05882.1 transposase [Paenibacillus sp. SYP-B3998]